MKPLIIILLVAAAVRSKAQKNVLYGERNMAKETLAACYDREGTLYPDYFIADSSLVRSGASLMQWYRDNITDFSRIAAAYHCQFDSYSHTNSAILNDSVVATLKRRIAAQRTSSNSVIFLVHGYRKPFKSMNGDSSSPADYDTLQTTIDRFSGKKTCYVGIYWDGTYDFLSKNLKHGKEILGLFVTARENAVKTGYQLRRLLTGLPFDTLNVITHSLGAEVACSALFDTSAEHAPTPSNKAVNLCLIAPAIGGVDRFKTYYNRNSGLPLPPVDNYRLCIVYNTNDFVLKKKIGIFGPGPYKYGVTSLGCDCDGAATTLRDYFAKNYPTSTIRLVDLSNTVKCHHVRCYSVGDNLKEMVLFMTK